ncbi:TonB-dependent siderophore receptor [soil metagenome]
MAFIKSRRHAAGRYTSGQAAAAATLVALGAPVMAQSQTLPQITVEAAPDYKVDKSASDKLTAPLLDTPKSVTIIPQEVIRQTGATTLVDALRTTPGITFGAGEGGNPVGDRPFIRGFDSQSDTYVDGVRDAASQTREIFNVESVEVMKGPSSAFGGRGSAGGAVNIITKKPQAENFLAGSVGIGTDSYARGTLDMNRVLSDGVAARLNLMDFKSDTPDRGPVNSKRWGVAPSVTFGMNSPTKVTLGYYHYETNDLPDSGIPYNNPFAATSANARLNGDGQPIAVPRGTYYGLANRDYQKTQVDASTIDVSHDFGNSWTFRNVTRYTKSSNDYLWTQPDDSKGNFLLNGTVWRRTNSRDSENDALVNQSSITGKFNTGLVKHTFAGGVEFGREETDRTSKLFQNSATSQYWSTASASSALGLTAASTSCAAGTGAATSYNCTSATSPNPYDPWNGVITTSPALTNVKTTTRSVYAFDTMEFSPQWSLNLGLRWDDYSTHLVTPAYANLSGRTPANASGAPTVAAVDLTNKSSFLNYQTGLVFKPAPNGSIYVAYGTSSTPPGTDAGDGADGLSAAIQNLEPQDSKSMELGTKWELLDKRIVLTGALFQTKMNNARVTQADGTTQNVGKKDVKGIEIGVAGNVTRELQVFGGYTHLNAKLADNGTGTSAAYNGNQFPNTPKDSATLWTTYTVMPGVTIGGGATYMGKQFGNTANTKWIPSYTTFDAMASYVVNKNLTLQLNVKNLTDKYYFDKAYASHYATVAAGRQVTLTANFSS